MARYAWKTTGADGTEATGTFAFTSVNLVAMTALVDVDGTLIADGLGGYSGGFGQDCFITVDPNHAEGDVSSSEDASEQA